MNLCVFLKTDPQVLFSLLFVCLLGRFCKNDKIDFMETCYKDVVLAKDGSINCWSRFNSRADPARWVVFFNIYVNFSRNNADIFMKKSDVKCSVLISLNRCCRSRDWSECIHNMVAQWPISLRGSICSSSALLVYRYDPWIWSTFWMCWKIMNTTQPLISCSVSV